MSQRGVTAVGDGGRDSTIDSTSNLFNNDHKIHHKDYNNNNISFKSTTSSSLSTGNLNQLKQTKQIYYRMSYVLISTDDFHRGPTRISTIDPYLHEKVPFTIIKDSLYFQAEPQYDPHGRYWKFRVEDAPVRVLNKLLDLGYKVLTGTSLPSAYEHKQPGHAWTLFRDPNTRFA